MKILDLGRKKYEEVWALQKQLLEKRIAGEIEDTLILVEHEPIYTVGRAGMGNHDIGEEKTAVPSSIHVRGLGDVPVVEVERGGKLTFHGPGQLVCYPIVHLVNRDLRKYLRELEASIIQILKPLKAKPCPETLTLEPGQLQTGVWVGDKKIASIGIACRNWVTYHGLAVNISTDLRYFEAVNPCGFSGAIMTNLESELPTKTADAKASKLLFEEVKAKVIELIQAMPAISQNLAV